MSGSSRRSWLVVPAHVDRLRAAARNAQPDVVVLDLTDPEAGPPSLAALRETVDACSAAGSEVFLSITAEQLRSVVEPLVERLRGVVLKPIAGPDQVVIVSDALAELERSHSINAPLEIIAALETAVANESAYEIAIASDRVTTLTLGQVDLVMDLRPLPNGEIHLLPHLLQRLVTIAYATGRSPIGAWWRPPARGVLADAEVTLAAARRARAVGCVGAWCATVDQIAALNEAFEPIRTGPPSGARSL